VQGSARLSRVRVYSTNVVPAQESELRPRFAVHGKMEDLSHGNSHDRDICVFGEFRADFMGHPVTGQKQRSISIVRRRQP
jgi:hypothetical protein